MKRLFKTRVIGMIKLVFCFDLIRYRNQSKQNSLAPINFCGYFSIIVRSYREVETYSIINNAFTPFFSFNSTSFINNMDMLIKLLKWDSFLS